MRETVVLVLLRTRLTPLLFLLISEHALHPCKFVKTDVVRLGYGHIRVSPHVRWKVEPDRIYDPFTDFLLSLVSIIKDYA